MLFLQTGHCICWNLVSFKQYLFVYKLWNLQFYLEFTVLSFITATKLDVNLFWMTRVTITLQRIVIKCMHTKLWRVINIHEWKCYQSPMVNCNGHLEPYASDATGAVMNLMMIMYNGKMHSYKYRTQCMYTIVLEIYPPFRVYENQE